ncbi:MAG: hypothetical protein WKH64_17835 [Chloroflexia bacterium]
MAEIDALREIQENAEVRSSDDAVLGKVVRVHFGEDLGRRHNITQMDVADTLDTQNLELSPEEAVPDAVLEVTLSESNDTVYVHIKPSTRFRRTASCCTWTRAPPNRATGAVHPSGSAVGPAVRARGGRRHGVGRGRAAAARLGRVGVWVCQHVPTGEVEVWIVPRRPGPRTSPQRIRP